MEHALARKIERRVQAARESGDDQLDQGDLAVAEELRHTYLGLAQTDSEILANVRAALGRIDEGTFGRCAIDGEPIEPQRLESVPWTQYCTKHQLELESARPRHTRRA
jgi:RNA polymerase-binding transcription factor DksA